MKVADQSDSTLIAKESVSPHTEKTRSVFDVRSVRMWYGHAMTPSSKYCRRNTQGDDTAPTESKNDSARNTQQSPDF